MGRQFFDAFPSFIVPLNYAVLLTFLLVSGCFSIVETGYLGLLPEEILLPLLCPVEKFDLIMLVY